MSKQTIYNQLRKHGLSKVGALALMGNWECESNNEPCRLQGDFDSSRSKSKTYAANVDNGSIAKTQFIKDQKGFGLAQWTWWSRKASLYDYCMSEGYSIADEEAQVSFAVLELQRLYPAVFDTLRTATDDDLYSATDLVCRKYECPAVNNVTPRFKAAKKLRDELDLDGKAEDKPKAKDKPTSPFWPPRMLDTGMVGADVMALQALLIAHGYSVTAVNGVFDGSTRQAATRFQSEHMSSTGAFGPKSWAALLKI